MLCDFIQTSLTPQQIGELLTMAGFELEHLEQVQDEPVLTIKVMSNRGDALSAFGLAREILAKDPHSSPTKLYLEACKDFFSEKPQNLDHPKVTIETSDCTRYACQIFEDFFTIDSPDWLKKRLELTGIRSLGLIVDLTNYVMIETGQPLHAFDLDTLKGEQIIVRKAKQGEILQALNEVTYELQPGQMMICDAEKPIAAAGIIGGKETEFNLNTKRILLEAAHFEPHSIRKTRKQLGVSTESSYRFERWVDPEGVIRGLNRFKQLYIQITGNQKSCRSGIFDIWSHQTPSNSVNVRISRAQKVLGMSVPAETSKNILNKLGFKITGEGEPFTALVPSWRPDVQREEDLIEEIGRVYGYENIPELTPVSTNLQGGVFGKHQKTDHIRALMIRSGFVQVITHSLRNKHPLDDPEHTLIQLRNPYSPETAFLRNSLLPCLSDVSKLNGSKNLHFFEIGKIFSHHKDQYQESLKLGIWSTGHLFDFHWSLSAQSKIPETHFFTLKGSIEKFSKALGIAIGFKESFKKDQRFHPTRQAEIYLEDQKISFGMMGQIHPAKAEALEIPPETYFAEISLEVLFLQPENLAKPRPLSRNPAIRRDLAIVAPQNVSYQQIEAIICTTADPILEKLWLFDLYTGLGIPEGFKSLGLALLLRQKGINLTDEEANQVRDQIVLALAELGATLRSEVH